MAEKILALLIAFFGGVAVMGLFGAKLINLAIRNSPPTRKLIRDALDREDARHADIVSQSFNAGVNAGVIAAHNRAGLCELCIDPIDKPYTDEYGVQSWRACPNQAARTVVLSGGQERRICEEHFWLLKPNG